MSKLEIWGHSHFSGEIREKWREIWNVYKFNQSWKHSMIMFGETVFKDIVGCI